MRMLSLLKGRRRGGNEMHDPGGNKTNGVSTYLYTKIKGHTGKIKVRDTIA